MNHNTANAIGFVAWLTLMGFLCWLWNSAWPLLMILCCGGFKTDLERETKQPGVEK